MKHDEGEEMCCTQCMTAGPEWDPFSARECNV